MTNDDIIKAAFKVWGRDLYRTTSLAEIALELGVSKPALYRHFKNKNALLDAMHTAFFDECAAFIKEGCEKAENAASGQEANLILMRTVAEYYVRNKEAFIFSLIRVYNGREGKNLEREFRERGINFERLASKKGESYPSMMQLIMVTLFFCVAEFHHRNYISGEIPSDEMVRRVLAQIEEIIGKGLKLDGRKVAALDYEGFERRAAEVVDANAEDNALLKAVAEAVAEAGPWHASMEMVAKRSGLSKSGLYAHFKNKQDMLAQLFIGEFNKIANFAMAQIETTEAHEEQLYLAIVSIVYYLRSRPEIFVAMDWIKTRQLNLGKAMPGRLYRIIRSIKMDVIRKYDQHFVVWVAKWVLFMIVNTLALWPSSISEKISDRNCIGQNKACAKSVAKNIAEIPNESFRILYRFISLGLEGLN